jgi:hypothetical protein
VRDSARVWNLYLQAKSWGNSPSDIVGLDMGGYEAYCLNEAVLAFGAHISSKLEEIEGKNKAQIEQKQQRLLERLLNPGKPLSSSNFRDPFSK